MWLEGRQGECSNVLMNDYDTQDIYLTAILSSGAPYIEASVVASRSIAF